jgi:glutamate/tyrosine decarboxylase-like PLP-dependent enzyme
MAERDELLKAAAHRAQQYLDTVAERPVKATLTTEQLRARLAVPLAAHGENPLEVIELLASAAREGTVATQGPRYFGFVVGGSLPVATAADWLVSAWDQNAGIYALSPLTAVLEQVAGDWIRGIVGLPPEWSIGYVTGGHMANFTALAAARNSMLQSVGWDAGAHGLFGAPPIDVVVSEGSHYTISTSLRLLGLGTDRVHWVPTDAQGRMRADELARVLKHTSEPCVVCAQAGNVNTGAFDPIQAIAAETAERGAWLHVDGAFGLWAAASPSLRHLVTGIERADSIAADAHKWLNVPYDCGIVLCAHAEAHRVAMTLAAAYIQETVRERDPHEYTPEESRRARAVPVYAALRALGSDGLAELVERCCSLARRMAERLAVHPAVEILNDVVLNQVLVRIADADDLTHAVIAQIQSDGVCWLGGTTWHDVTAIRISVCNWSTTAEDIDRSVEAILAAVDTVMAKDS